MRTWLSFRTGIRGVRVGVALPNPAARTYYVSATGRKVCRWANILRSGGIAHLSGPTRDVAGRHTPGRPTRGLPPGMANSKCGRFLAKLHPCHANGK
jgi:hypothetical protein